MRSAYGMQANKMLFFQKICQKKYAHAPNVKKKSGWRICGLDWVLTEMV